MNSAEARQWLDAEWDKALAENVTAPDSDIDVLANARGISIRYALVTQLLGKIADPSRSLFALQLAAGGEGAWDARSFSTAVIVPWVAASNNVLGTSAEPYASKPLRRERLESDMSNVRRKADWNRLVSLFEELEHAEHAAVVETFRRVLRSLVRRLASQTFGYAIPQRISLPRLQAMLAAFLAEPSGGLRPLAVATALFGIVGKAFSLFSRVESQGINEADAAGGMPGDVICYCYDDPDRVCLVVEVKDLELTLAHVESSSFKAKQSSEGLSNFLFAVPGVNSADRADIEVLSEQEWASGMNIYSASIDALVDAMFVLLDERWRVELLRAIGDGLDERADQLARRAWHDLLRDC